MVVLHRTLSRILLIALCALSAEAASAGICGDDVGGARIACACGDWVVSDTRLARTDPVVQERCNGDGLTLNARDDEESLTLDLAGLQLTGRRGGIGIRVRDGGRDGAVLIGGQDGRPGQVAGFRVGISAQGTRGIRAAENLIVFGNETDGVRIAGRGAILRGVVSDDNGRSGVRVHGRDHALAGVSAAGNGRSNLQVSGNAQAISTDPAKLERGMARGTGRRDGGVPASEVE